MKKIYALLAVLILFPLISSVSLDIEFSSDTTEFSPSSPLTFKVTAYDDEGKPINEKIEVWIEDSERVLKKVEISSGDFVVEDISDLNSGQGTITAKYGEDEAIAFFYVLEKEDVKFEINGNQLIVKNNGNSLYNRKITITIGETVGTKQPHLEPGESVVYRLIAPDGDYSLKVTDGTEENTLTRNSIRLTGTGNVVGALDESASQRAGITGGVSPDENSDIALLSYIKRNTFIYVFVAVIFAAMILVGIERGFKKKAKK